MGWWLWPYHFPSAPGDGIKVSQLPKASYRASSNKHSSSVCQSDRRSGMPCLATDEGGKAVTAACSASVHAGVSSDTRAGCTSEGWTSDVYQRVFLAAQDAVTWQSANRFVAPSSLESQHPTLNVGSLKAVSLASALRCVCCLLWPCIEGQPCQGEQ